MLNGKNGYISQDCWKEWNFDKEGCSFVLTWEHLMVKCDYFACNRKELHMLESCNIIGD
jgi:hypothetical protein